MRRPDDEKIANVVLGILRTVRQNQDHLLEEAVRRGIDIDQLTAAAITEALHSIAYADRS